jgi:hypothetical protein
VFEHIDMLSIGLQHTVADLHSYTHPTWLRLWDIVRMSDCCLQGIQPCECKGEGHRWVGNQVFKMIKIDKRVRSLEEISKNNWGI